MINNSTNINKMNDDLSPQTIEHRKTTTYILLPRTWGNVVKVKQGLDFCSSTFNI